jgi:carboxyl-terminal processing protease
MQLRKLIVRTLALSATAFVAFCGGLRYDYNGLMRATYSSNAIGQAISSIPQNLMFGLRTIAHGDQDDNPLPYSIFIETLTTVQSDYYGPTKPTRDLAYASIRGMMASLGDRYTRFMDPTEFAKMQEDTEGEFVGIGAELEQNAKGQVYVVKPLPNSPAMKAHLLRNDIIVKVDQKSIMGMDLNDAIKLIRGKANTKVILTILRKGAAAPLQISIIRNKVRQEVVVSQMIDKRHKIGYIALAQFNEESDGQINQALKTLHAEGMRGLVFDLRENPGGLLTVAEDVASRFVPSGPIVWVKERGRKMQSYDVEPKQHNFPRYPLVVLVDSGSASASEITSGAIKDTRSGTLVGDQTFGKGLVQTIIPCHDQSAVAITTAHYFTPAKHDINHKGITPDIVIHLTDQDLRQMDSYSTTHADSIVDLKYDRQLQKGVSVMIAKLSAGSHPESWPRD